MEKMYQISETSVDNVIEVLSAVKADLECELVGEVDDDTRDVLESDVMRLRDVLRFFKNVKEND